MVCVEGVTIGFVLSAKSSMVVGVRAIIIREGRLVCVEHVSNASRCLSLPGGGVLHGESLAECVVREVLEETGMVVEPHDFVAVRELAYNGSPALEFIVRCSEGDREPVLGVDPELPLGAQELIDVFLLSKSELMMAPTFEPRELVDIVVREYEKPLRPSSCSGGGLFTTSPARR